MIDITIIGGGPNGIYCYKNLKQCFHNKKILLIEKDTILSNLKKYPNILWHSQMKELTFDENIKKNNIHPTTSQIVNYYTDYFKKNNLSFLQDEVINIIKNNDNYNVYFKNNNIIVTKYLILCTGIFENIRTLSINTNFSYINYSYPDFSLKNKHLVLIGGGNSSLDYIIHLLPNNRITWILKTSYTKNSCHLSKFYSICNKYKNNLTIFENTEIKEFTENNTAILSNNKIINNINYCNILIGYTYKNKLLEKIGIEYTKDNYIKINEYQETNLRNIYVFGAISSQKNNMIFIHNGNLEILKKIIINIKLKV